MTIGEQINTYRKQKGMTQEALANALGVTGQAVSKWENDQSYPDITLLPALADLFEISLDALFGREIPIPVPAQPVQGAPSDLPWEDDGTLRVVVYMGRSLIEHTRETSLTVTLDGAAANVEVWGDLQCDNVAGNVSAGGQVSCGDVAGHVSAGGGVECGDVEGNIEAGGQVSCGDVEGSVTSGGSVECGDVDGNIQAMGNVSCGDVDGDVTAVGNVSCGDVDGDVIHR